MLHAGDAELLAQAFGLDGDVRLEGPVDRGEQGQVWRLEASGQRYAVKETFAPLDDEQAGRADTFQRAAAAVGVRAPEPVPTRDGRVVVRVGAEAVRLYRWVDLAAPERRVSPQELGGCLARLHRVGSPVTSPIDPWYFEPVGRGRWEDLTRRLGEQGAPFSARLAALVDELVEVETLFVEPANRILCHRDLVADNVRAASDGRLLVIDWDNCGAASPDQELAMVLLEFGLDDDRISGIYQSYCSAGGPGRITSASDLTMPAAVVGHLGELACRQWLEAADEAGRSRAAARMDEFLGEPWTLTLLERVVDVVSGAPE